MTHLSTPHIDPQGVPIAETILLPGDPLRAKFIAETYLDDPRCFNRVRNMLGYTGTYRGREISVMGTGIIANAAASLPLFAGRLSVFALVVWCLASSMLIGLVLASAFFLFHRQNTWARRRPRMMSRYCYYLARRDDHTPICGQKKARLMPGFFPREAITQLRQPLPALRSFPDDPAARHTPSAHYRQRGSRTSGCADNRRCGRRSADRFRRTA